MTINVGDTVKLKVEFKDENLAYQNPTTVILTVQLPDSTTLSPTPASASTGIYTAVVETTMTGLWTYKWVGTGTYVAEEEGSFQVEEGDFDSFTLIVEDGTGLTNSNSYLSLSDALTLIKSTAGNVDWQLASASQRQVALIAATQYVDTKWRFYGQVMDTTQALQWPRTKNWDSQGNLIPPGTLPIQLKKALLGLANIIVLDLSALTTEVSADGIIKSFSVEGLSVTFGETKATQAGAQVDAYLLGTRYPDVELLLRSIGTFIDLEYLQENKHTQVRVTT